MLIFMCGACGYILYEGNELKTPSEIVREYGGKCPNCKRTIKPSLKYINVLPVREE